MRRSPTPFRHGMSAERHALQTARIERAIADLKALVAQSEDFWSGWYLAQWLVALGNLRRLARKLKGATAPEPPAGDDGPRPAA